MYYVTTSGGRIYKPFGFEYIQGIFSYFFRTDDVELICAQNLDVVDDPQRMLQDAMNEIDRRFNMMKILLVSDSHRFWIICLVSLKI